VTAANLGADLDAVLSVDAIGVYKPQPAVYAMVTDRFGVAPAEVAFVSSNRWDVMGATAFGFRCVWVNRANLPDEYPELVPVQIVPDLASLATLALP
jgi:2-haloacid dehalogenase